MAAVNVLTLTATHAQALLAAGALTSVQLVEIYLVQIDAHNHSGAHLNALISVAPRRSLIAQAERLDSERASGKLRGPLHGIPFIAKDVFVTAPSLGMPTTAGGLCFRRAKGRRTAPLLQRLLEDEGMLLLGKANLSEFCGLKQRPLQPGWSAAGGQTQNPYVFGGVREEDGGKMLAHASPGGSSSGSGAGVAAGFAPLAIGTECVGSVVVPANRCGLYALKCGQGKVDHESGGFGFTDCVDCVGSMGKSAADVALFAQKLMGRRRPFEIGQGFDGMRVGWLDPKVWQLPDGTAEWNEGMREYMETGFASSMRTLADNGAHVEECQSLTMDWNAFNVDEEKRLVYEIAMYQFHTKFLPRFIQEFDECEVQTLEDIIKYNEDHAAESMPPSHPSQHEFHDILATPRTAEQTRAYIDEYRKRGREQTAQAFESHDVLVALADSALCMWTSASGYPIAVVPLGMLQYSEQNERPYGVSIAAKRGQEELLLRFMSAWEAVMPSRPLPKPLLDL